MSVDLSAVRRIAHLARIGVSEAEIPHLQDEINAVRSAGNLSFAAGLVALADRGL